MSLGLPPSDTAWLVEHWPALLGAALVVFGLLFYRFGRGGR